MSRMKHYTIAEAVISNLIEQGQLDESNPQLVREYAEKAEALGISTLDFYTKVYDVEAWGRDCGTIERVLTQLDIF